MPAASAQSVTDPEKRTGAFYDRHQAINKKVMANQNNVDLIFVGDSITQGWEVSGRMVWDGYYGDRKALNLGVRGDRTQHVLWRLDNGNLKGIQPKVAVVMIGTNNVETNTVSEVVDGVIAVVKKLQAKVPGIKIILLDIFPRGQSFNNSRGNILQVNQTVRKLHDGENIIYLPVGHFFLESDGTISRFIMPDFVHLSPIGYEIWATHMESTLAVLLGDSPGSRSSANRLED